MKLIISIACSFKDSQNVFVQSLPLYTSCLFSMLLNDDIVETEKSDRMCSLIFAVEEISALFSHLSIFSIQHSRYALIMNGALSNF